MGVIYSFIPLKLPSLLYLNFFPSRWIQTCYNDPPALLSAQKPNKEKQKQEQANKNQPQNKHTKNQDHRGLIETERKKQVCTEGKGYFPHSLTSVIKTSTIALRPNPQILSKFIRCSLQPKMYKNYDVWNWWPQATLMRWWWQIISVGNGKKKKRKKTNKQTNK